MLLFRGHEKSISVSRQSHNKKKNRKAEIAGLSCDVNILVNVIIIIKINEEMHNFITRAIENKFVNE